MADLVQAKAEIDRILRVEEGERLKPYLCDAGVATIGVGDTTYPDGRPVSLSDPPITKAQMDRMLDLSIDKYIPAVLAMVDGQCTTNQLIGLVVCSYNIGLAGMRGSTMIRAHRAGDYAAAARAFRLWNKYRKTPSSPLEVHPALDARRGREAAIYATPDDRAWTPERPPQAVEGESKLVSSPILKGGLATIATGVMSGLGAAAEALKGIGDPLKAAKAVMVDTLGVPPSWILPIVLIVAGVVVVQWRYRQRAGGWS